MNRRPVVLSPEMTIEQAIGLLLLHQVSGAPVVATPTGCIVGMLTEMDCVGLVAGNSYHDEGSLSGLCVQDLATPVKVTVSPTTDLFAVVQRFLTTRVRLLPVVDCGTIVGVVSRRDVLQVILRL